MMPHDVGLCMNVTSFISHKKPVYLPKNIRFSYTSKLTDIDCFNYKMIYELTEHINELIPVIVGIAFLSTLEQTVMSKTLSAKTGEPLNLNQDTFAVGMANMGSALTTSLP